MLRSRLESYKSFQAKLYDTEKPRFQRVHVEHSHKLNLLLLHRLLHHEIVGAAQVVQTLAGFYHNNPGAVRKGSLEVLLHYDDTEHEVKQLLKQLYLRHHSLREELTLENVIFLARRGHVQEAWELMLSRECKDPCFSNPLCRGYCGLLGAYLWEEEGGTSLEDVHMSTNDAQEDKILDVEVAHGHHEDQQLAGSYAKFALKDFAEFQRLARSKQGVFDSFVNKHWQFLVQLGRQEDALDVLKWFRETNPQRINAHRYMLQYISMVRVCGVLSAELAVLEEECWNDLAHLDPSCSEVLLLAEHLLQKDSCDPKRVFLFLVEFLDHPHNALEMRAWELLRIVQNKWPACLTCDEWSKRMRWWRKIHSAQLSLLFANGV